MSEFLKLDDEDIKLIYENRHNNFLVSDLTNKSVYHTDEAVQLIIYSYELYIKHLQSKKYYLYNILITDKDFFVGINHKQDNICNGQEYVMENMWIKVIE